MLWIFYGYLRARTIEILNGVLTALVIAGAFVGLAWLSNYLQGGK